MDVKTDLGEIISDSLRYPFQDIGKLLLLFLLFLVSFTVVLLPLYLGYLLRIIEQTSHGSNELPDFNEWEKMFADGVKYFVANIIYLIIPIIFLIISFVGFIGIIRQETAINAFPVFILVGLSGVVLYIIFNLLFIMALGNMAYEQRFGSAFKLSKILGLIKGIGYLKYFVYVLVVFIIAFLIGIIPSIISAPIRLLGFTVTGFYLISMVIALPFSLYAAVYGSRFKGLIYLLGLVEEGNVEIVHNEEPNE